MSNTLRNSLPLFKPQNVIKVVTTGDEGNF